MSKPEKITDGDFIIVPPDNPEVLQFLVEEERVHKLRGGVEELLRYRLGNVPRDMSGIPLKENFSLCAGMPDKVIFGLVNGSKLQAAISTRLMHLPQSNGIIHASNAPGDIPEMLQMPWHALTQEKIDDTNCLACYTISSFTQGAGGVLIRKLHNFFKEHSMAIITVTPVKNLPEWIEANPDEKIAEILFNPNYG